MESVALYDGISRPRRQRHIGPLSWGHAARRQSDHSNSVVWIKLFRWQITITHWWK